MMSYCEFIMNLKYSNIHKYIMNSINTQNHDITVLKIFVTVSKNDIAVLLNFGILQSPSIESYDNLVDPQNLFTKSILER